MHRPTLVPEFYVSSLAKSLAFYVDLLGFELRYARPEASFAAVSCEGGELLREEFSAVKTASDLEFEQGHWRTADFEYPLGRSVNFEFTVTDVEQLHARVFRRGLCHKTRARREVVPRGRSECRG
jgi:catechol 2,3-dioxygenase-like lactoylglutathione lyase family enzyme